MSTVYEPLNTLKQVADNIWVVDGPQISFYGMPFPTRMTVIRLESGALFLHSPIAIDEGLKAELETIGEIRHLVSPNWIHYAGISGWQQAYPEALAWASPNVRKRAAKYGVNIRFDRDLGDSTPQDWADEINQLIVHGSSAHTEVVFFHKSSKTLILTDLIENFEGNKVVWWLRPIIWLTGNGDPDGKAPVDMRFTFRRGKAQAKKAVLEMLGWQPERVILAHGRWYETNAVAELKRAFRWLLR